MSLYRRRSDQQIKSVRRRPTSRRKLIAELLEDRRLLAVIGSMDFESADPGDDSIPAPFTSSVNLVSETNNRDTLIDVPGDMFGVGRRDLTYPFRVQDPDFEFAVNTLPFAIADDSVSNSSGDGGSFGGDTLGVVGVNKIDGFFGVTDTVTTPAGGTDPDTNPDTGIATWEFDFNGTFGSLQVSIDMGAMGDFEASDTFLFEIDLGFGFQPLFAPTVNEDIDHTYLPFDDGDIFTLNDPIQLDVGGSVVTLDKADAATGALQTFTTSVPGTASSATIRFTATVDGGEAFVFDNILIEGEIPTKAVTILETDLSTDVVEGGETDSFSVVLDEAPATGQTVTVNIATDGETLVAPTSLIFTTGNWDVAQPVTVTADDDADAEGNHTGVISFSVVSGDLDYNGLAVGDLIANIGDNDGTDASVVLNEIYVNPPSDDDSREYLEILSTTGGAESLTGLWLIAIEGDAGSAGTATGLVEFAQDLSSLSTGSNGLLLLGSDYGSVGTPWGSLVDPSTSLADLNASFENGSTTVMLVTNFTGAAGDDLDTDDDGGFDATPWTGVIDSVGWTDGGATDLTYSPAALTQTFGSPDAATRFIGDNTIESTLAWYNGDIDGFGGFLPLAKSYDPTSASSNLPTEGRITPGAANTTGLGPAAVVLLPTDGSNDIVEGGATDTFEVVLTARPTAPVTVTLIPDGEQTLDLTTLTFSNNDLDTNAWNVPQQVTITAVNDSDVEGGHLGSIGVNASDSAYSILGEQFVNVMDDAADSTLTINEIRISASSGGLGFTEDFVNHFEIYETGGNSVGTQGLTLLVLNAENLLVDDGNGTPVPSGTSGQITRVLPLDGGSTDFAGYFLLANTDHPYGTLSPGDLTVDGLDFSGSPTSYLLVAGYTGPASGDLDTDDDGTFDTIPWTVLLDSVSLEDDFSDDVSIGEGPEVHYSPNVLGDGSDDGFVPAGLHRIPNGTGAFSLLSFGNNSAEIFGEHTPGASNTGVTPGGTVVDQFIFYNDSFYDDPDGSGPMTGIGAGVEDDAARDLSKSALLPEQGAATFANYTGYTKGINGIMIDIAGLPVDPVPADFVFTIGNDSTPGDWTPVGTSPAITVRDGAGTGGSDRVTLIWPSDTITNTWLEVTVLSTGPNAIVDTDFTFYFGNWRGEVGAGDTQT